MIETKVFLGKKIPKQPPKIVRELVDYMLQVGDYLSFEALESKLLQTNSRNNLRTRIRRSLTNTPDVVNQRDSDQSRKFSIPMQYKNIRVLNKEDKYKLELVNGRFPEIREEDYTAEDLKEYMSGKENTQFNVKKEFTSWLLKNAPTSYNYYLGDSVDSVITRLNEIESFFPNINFFTVNQDNVSQLIQVIKQTFSSKERIKHPSFVEYDKLNSNGIPKAILGKNNYIKFLKEKFEYSKPNYWIFQGNPSIYDIKNALKAGHLKSWKVAAHKDKIKIGDKAIIWQTGNESGCYAIAEVISEVRFFEQENYEKQYYVKPQEDRLTERVQIKIINYLADDPILWSDIKEDPIFKDFKAGNQGTNFSVTKEEFNRLEEIISIQNKGSYSKIKQLLDGYKFNSFLSVIRVFIAKNNLAITDNRISCNVRED